MPDTLPRLHLGNEFIRDHEGRTCLVTYKGDRTYVNGEVIEGHNDCYLVRMSYGAIKAFYIRLGFALPCAPAASARWEAAARKRGVIA